MVRLRRVHQKQIRLPGLPIGSEELQENFLFAIFCSGGTRKISSSTSFQNNIIDVRGQVKRFSLMPIGESSS